MNFIELLTYLSPAPEVEKRNRELIEKKKAELGTKYAHHKTNHVKRKDGQETCNCQQRLLVN